MNQQPPWPPPQPPYGEQPYGQPEWNQQVPPQYQQLPPTQYAVPPVSNYLPSQMEYNIPPPPPLEYRAYPYGPYQYDPYQKIFKPHPEKTVLKVIRVIFYFVLAYPIATFGLIGVSIESGSSSVLVGGFALFFTCALLVTSIIVFYRTRHRIQRFGWAQFICWVLAATGGLFIALVFNYALINKVSQGFILGVLFFSMVLRWRQLLYGSP